MKHLCFMLLLDTSFQRRFFFCLCQGGRIGVVREHMIITSRDNPTLNMNLIYIFKYVKCIRFSDLREYIYIYVSFIYF